MGKTETIKERAIYVYLPSSEMMRRWKGKAKRRGTSISKFVMGHVENSLRQEEEADYRSRGELLKELGELKEQLREEQKKSRRLDVVVDKLESELRRYRAQPFLDDDFSGIRRFQQGLVEILKEEGVHNNEEILFRLNVEPSEHEVIRGISKQLEILESYGLVQASPRGWRWLE